MKNLQKTLSLVLAMVMIFGMFAVTANAAELTDLDKVTPAYAEAVAVVNGLGIIEGDENGVFNPKGEITRAGAAKLVTYITLGKEGAEALSKNVQPFTDVPAGEWYAGYVNYCAAQGYINGNGDGTFNPDAPISGYGYAKLMLTALGYGVNDEYIGEGYPMNVAKDALAAGIYAGNLAGMSDEPATREEAALYTFNALKANQVVHTHIRGYQDTGVTLGYDKYALTEIDGVVTANEYADLYDDEPLKAGKTTIGDVTYNVSTELTDIGESRLGWASGKDVLYLVDSGDNTVLSTGAATKINAKFQKDNGITADTEWYLNFGGEYTVWTCEYLLTYGYKDNKYDDGTAAPAEVIVRAGKAIDVDALKAVFNDNNGYVYLGTKNTDDDYDFSSEMTWTYFKATYLDNAVDSTAISSTENGEWLKVVDNDGDKKADYVFVTEFTMAEVTGLSAKGVLTLDGDTYGGTYDLPYATSADLAKDEVVIYTVIDGVCYVELADNFMATVQKYSYKNEIMTTTDGEEYAQSGIIDHTDYIYNELEQLDDETYIFYVDFFGYIRVAAEPAEAADNYLLLTEFYGTGSNADNLISTRALIAETVDTVGNVEEYEVGTVKKAWDVHEDLISGQTENWVKSVDGTESWTNVAAYALTDELLSLDTAYNVVFGRDGETIKALTDYIDLDTDEIAKGQRHFDIDDDNNYVNVTQNTIIFYVLGTAADEIDAVDVVVGYKNIVPVKNINAVYAVADMTAIDTVDDDPYWEAQILVIEAENYVTSYKDTLAFVYSNPEKESKKVFSLEDIAVDGTLDVLYVENDFVAGQYVADTVDPLAFYPTHENKKGYDVMGEEITEDYAAWNIYAGEFKRYQEAAKMDYIDVVIDGKVVSVDMPATAVAYSLSQGKNGTYSVAKQDLAERTNKGDRIIYVTNKDGEIVYIIDVDTSFTKGTEGAAARILVALWTDIVADATLVTPPTPEYWTVTVSKDDAKYTVDGLGTQIEKGTASVEFTVTEKTGYDVTVAATGATLNDKGAGKYELYNITGNIEVTVTATVEEVSFTLNRGGYINKIDVYNGTTLVDTLAYPTSTKNITAQEGIELTFVMDVDAGYEVAGCTVDENGKYVGTATVEAGKTVAFAATSIKYAVSVDGANLTASIDEVEGSKALKDVTITLTAETGYTLPAALTSVKVGESELAAANYSYNNTTGVITFVPNVLVDGDIVIEADAVIAKYAVRLTSSYPGSVTAKAGATNIPNDGSVVYLEHGTVVTVTVNDASVTSVDFEGDAIEIDALTLTGTFTVTKAGKINFTK